MGEKYRVMLCAGSRPELIKLVPLYRLLHQNRIIRPVLCLTGQHQDLLQPFLAEFGIQPDVMLQGETVHRSLEELNRRLFRQLPHAIKRHAPHLVIVQGDTTSALTAAVVATRLSIPVAHVEAGLRTYDVNAPFPEEINRQTISTLASWHFCPTERNRQNLLNEGRHPAHLFVTDNTGIDMLLQTLGQRQKDPQNPDPAPSRPYFLITLHRRESHGYPLRRILNALRKFAEAWTDYDFIMPVHPNPAVKSAVHALFQGPENVRLLPPVAYGRFVGLMQKAFAILTDSGGIQEEAPALNVPVVVLRDKTERQEGVQAGCLRLAGTGPNGIFAELALLIQNPDHYIRISRAPNPYGDGRASERIGVHLNKILTGQHYNDDKGLYNSE